MRKCSVYNIKWNMHDNSNVLQIYTETDTVEENTRK